ncbi:nitrogenase component 1 [Fusibacter bizertensis]
MGLIKYSPIPSGRMGIIWTLASIGESVIIEFGSMGHMLYMEKWHSQLNLRKKARLYTTHISETDIALGNTDRLMKAIEEIIEQTSVKVVFLLPSTVPLMIGTDYKSVKMALEERYSELKFIIFEKGGFDVDWVEGIEEALYKQVSELVLPKTKVEITTYNIIGATPELVGFKQDVYEIERILKNAFNYSPLCVFNLECSLDEIEKASNAQVNIVIRSEGIKAAKEMQKRHGTPYIFCRPYGKKQTTKWLTDLGEIIGQSPNSQFIAKEEMECELALGKTTEMINYLPQPMRIVICAHKDIAFGLNLFFREEVNNVNVSAWATHRYLSDASVPFIDEAGLLALVKDSERRAFYFLDWQMGEKLDLKYTAMNKDLSFWEINPYTPPYIGYRGMLHLLSKLTK